MGSYSAQSQGKKLCAKGNNYVAPDCDTSNRDLVVKTVTIQAHTPFDFQMVSQELNRDISLSLCLIFPPKLKKSCLYYQVLWLTLDIEY